MPKTHYAIKSIIYLSWGSALPSQAQIMLDRISLVKCALKSLGYKEAN